jgi:hypothetical protein
MRRPHKKIHLIAFALALSLPAAGTARANTVDIVHDGFGAYGAMTFWGGGHNGNVIMGGVYQLNKTNSTGIGDTWHNGLVPGFCMEIHEPAPETTHTYTVMMPDDVYNSYTGEVLGVTKANYLRELWARFYDPAWAAGGTYTEQQNRAAEAFAAAVWEIVYEKLPVSPAAWDVTVDGTIGLGGFRAEELDFETANKWLHNLTGSGPKADLLAFVHDGQQNYLVAVPEPATILLLGLGGMCSVLGWKRRSA